MEKWKMNVFIYLVFVGFAVTYANPQEALSSSYQFVRQIGSFGTGDGQFYYPTDVAIDTQGNIYATDPDAVTSRIQKFSSNGIYVGKWGSYGTGDGEFHGPKSIAIDSSDHVYVVDTGNHRIQEFSSNGGFVTKWGSLGGGDGQFDNPLHICVDFAGNINVLDASNGRIQKFTPDGTYMSKWDTGSTNDQAIAVDSLGNVYVTGNFTVKKFDASGTLITQWGSEGAGDGQFKGAYGIAVDPFGRVYVSDYFNHRIQEFTSEGVFVAKFGAYGTDNGQFRGPEGIVFDQLGNLYVADRENHRVQVFAPALAYEGTVGTEITIEGSNFGIKKGKVLIDVIKLKVLDWKTDSILCRLTKPLDPGTYGLEIQPNEGTPVVYENGFIVKAPEIASVTPSHAVAGAEVEVKGNFFGVKKGKVTIKGESCKVLDWAMNSTTGVSSLRFVVPKGLNNDAYDLEITNKVGEDTESFTID